MAIHIFPNPLFFLPVFKNYSYCEIGPFQMVVEQSYISFCTAATPKLHVLQIHLVLYWCKFGLAQLRMIYHNHDMNPNIL